MGNSGIVELTLVDVVRDEAAVDPNAHGRPAHVGGEDGIRLVWKVSTNAFGHPGRVLVGVRTLDGQTPALDLAQHGVDQAPSPGLANGPAPGNSLVDDGGMVWNAGERQLVSTHQHQAVDVLMLARQGVAQG